MEKYELRDDLNEIFNDFIDCNYSYYEVWFLMKGYNVWHKATECSELEFALKECERLEKNSECWTEIKFISKYQKIYRRYKKVEG